MKKLRQEHKNDRTKALRTQDLAAVRGGDDGVLHAQRLFGGAAPNENGVIHMDTVSNGVATNTNGVIHSD